MAWYDMCIDIHHAFGQHSEVTGCHGNVCLLSWCSYRGACAFVWVKGGMSN